MSDRLATRRLNLWTVEIDEHDVGPAHNPARHHVEALTVTIPGVDRQQGRLDGVRQAHIRSKVPPWRPYVRQSWPHSRVTEHVNGLVR